MRAARRQGVARAGSLYNRAFAKGACSRPLLFNIFAAVVNVAYTRFKADKYIMDTLVHLRKKKGAGGGGGNCRRASPGDAALGHA